MPKALRKTYQLKITLKDSKPPIWRRFLVEHSITLDHLHHVIQIVMGWANYHLHQFIASGKFYGRPDPEFEDFIETLDEKKFKLKELLKKEKSSIIYEYDFGDGWQHKITLEKVLPFDLKQPLPVCLKAKGACPPEDVGGLWGYYDFLEALSDQDHPEHDEFIEWIGGEFDPLAYDLKAVNDLLAKYCR